MDIFPGWEGYLPKLEANWRRLIAPDDTVVLVGDTSWAMNLKDTKADFAFIESLPGQKWILKGNHDYWWTTRAKMDRFFAGKRLYQPAYPAQQCLHGAEGVALCGSRGWPFDDASAQDAKVMAREAGRLRMSLAAGGDGEKWAFLHYPPVYPGACAPRAWWTCCTSSA